ncbi:MAG: BRO family protein [Candidatus Delongbacteria bacterium]
MSNIKLFESKKIRSHWDEKEEKWYFSVVDVIEVLTDSVNPTDYLKKLRKRDAELGNYIGTNCPQVEMITSTGKFRKTLAATAENLLRIIQSIPSPKAEPFKLWLAKVGYERLEEIENPELAQERMKELYELKGYPKDWIDKRLRGIAVRQNLTEEWKQRGIESQSDFAILTAEISKATFGMTPSQYKEFKDLPKKSEVNLRDHMNDLELIFTMLGERVTTEISQKEKPETFTENRKVAKRGGKVAGNARKETEKELKRSIVSKDNFLDLNNKLQIDDEEE